MVTVPFSPPGSRHEVKPAVPAKIRREGHKYEESVEVQSVYLVSHVSHADVKFMRVRSEHFTCQSIAVGNDSNVIMTCFFLICIATFKTLQLCEWCQCQFIHSSHHTCEEIKGAGVNPPSAFPGREPRRSIHAIVPVRQVRGGQFDLQLLRFAGAEEDLGRTGGRVRE